MFNLFTVVFLTIKPIQYEQLEHLNRLNKNNMNKFYITTPIYYVNGKPSIGHAYTAIAADVLARYHRMLGEEVLFQTGTDENSQKNLEAAAKVGRENDVQGYLDEMAAVWERTFDSLGLTHNRFIRTTEALHFKAVEKFWNTVKDNDDIYLGTYEGLYCQGCEAFVNENDLVDGLCPFHKKAPSSVKEQNYFFKLTKYRDDLLAYIGEHPEFIQPESRRNEVLSYVRDFMADISISRETMNCGIPVPSDEKHRIYVWFDALINYLSGIGYGTDDQNFEKWWPANLHLVGKDIIKFHCALWPAMLMSAGLPLPKQVFAHGFFTIDGQKMSKSLGNTVDSIEVSEKYGLETVRYFLLREIPFGADGDFTWDDFILRYNGDLANGIGNLVSRTANLIEKAGQVNINQPKLIGQNENIDNYKLDLALKQIQEKITAADQLIDREKPWQLIKTDKTKAEKLLARLAGDILAIATELKPFLPATAEKIEKIFTAEKITKPQIPLFPRI